MTRIRLLGNSLSSVLRILKVMILAASIGITFLVIFPVVFVYFGLLLNFPAIPSIPILGFILFFTGVTLFFYCSYLFITFGNGTPAPVDPPKKLVPNNIYNYTRNPMYVGYILMVMGEVVFFGKLALVFYAVLLFLSIHCYVVFVEEPKLEKRFKNDYIKYKNKVPRWLF